MKAMREVQKELNLMWLLDLQNGLDFTQRSSRRYWNAVGGICSQGRKDKLVLAYERPSNPRV